MTVPNELDLIATFRRKSLHSSSHVAIGIGDDAAMLQSHNQNSSGQLATVDMLMDGVHFDAATTSGRLIGQKAMSVNLSDIAAMGGRPTVAFVALSLNRKAGSSFANDIYDGIVETARRFRTTIAGGDTNIWDGPLVISITLLGECIGPQPVLRSGAQPGDWLMVTGALGGSLSGRHLSFTPRLETAQFLCNHCDLHAMMDLSDGIAKDLPRMAEASQVGFVLDPRNIPIHTDVDQSLPPNQRLDHALCDGEDFELMFCVNQKTGEHLLSIAAPVPVTKIGTATQSPGCYLKFEDKLSPLPNGGYEHKF